MAGQTITVIGEVVMVTTSFTKEHKTFATVSLEDISGRLEIMVWPRTYEDTKELWVEGNILEVKGKVRMRDEHVQFAADGARPYQPERQPNEQVKLSNGKHDGNNVLSLLPKQWLTVNLQQTEDMESDLANLAKLIDIFKSYPGKDEVSLRVVNGTTITNLKLPVLFVDYSAEMRRRLVEIVGEQGIFVEKEGIKNSNTTNAE